MSGVLYTLPILLAHSFSNPLFVLCCLHYQDTDFCGGIVANPNFEQMFDDVSTCCANLFGYIDPELCEALTLDTYTGKIYVDYTSMVCVKDCEGTTKPCGGHPSDVTTDLYGTIEECCDLKLSWLNISSCVDDSNGGTPIRSPTPPPTTDPLTTPPPTTDPLTTPPP